MNQAQRVLMAIAAGAAAGLAWYQIRESRTTPLRCYAIAATVVILLLILLMAGCAFDNQMRAELQAAVETAIENRASAVVSPELAADLQGVVAGLAEIKKTVSDQRSSIGGDNLGTIVQNQIEPLESQQQTVRILIVGVLAILGGDRFRKYFGMYLQFRRDRRKNGLAAGIPPNATADRVQP